MTNGSSSGGDNHHHHDKIQYDNDENHRDLILRIQNHLTKKFQVCSGTIIYYYCMSLIIFFYILFIYVALQQ
jgi:hypothetical protein